MDVNTAIELLRNNGGCTVAENGVIRLNTDMLIKLLERQKGLIEVAKNVVEEYGVTQGGEYDYLIEQLAVAIKEAE